MEGQGEKEEHKGASWSPLLIFLSFNLASHVLFSNVRRDTLSTTLLYVFFNQSDHVYHLQESNKNGITDL